MSVRPSWSNDHEMDDSPGRGTGSLNQGGLRFREMFWMEHLAASQNCLNVLRAIDATALRLERTPLPLGLSYTNRIHRNCLAFFCRVYRLK